MATKAKEFDLVVPETLTRTMNGALTWWMQTYQPELLQLTMKEYVTLIQGLAGKDAYQAARCLEIDHGWKPNAELICCLADVIPMNQEKVQKLMGQGWL